jgi:actin-related protein
MAMSLRGVLKLVYPIEGSKIENSDALEKLIHQQLYDKLRVDPSDREICIVLPPMMTHKDIRTLCTIMFDTFQVKGLYLVPEPISIAITNKTLNAVIVNIGIATSYIALVENGFMQSSSFTPIDIGLRDIEDLFFRLLRNREIEVKTSATKDALKPLLMEEGYTSLDIKNEKPKLVTHVMPDGTTIQVGEELFLALEALFDPSLVGKETVGIVKAIKTFLGEYCKEKNYSISFTGTCTYFKNFRKRLKKELEGIDLKFLYTDEKTNAEANWLGASYLIKKGMIKMITKDEYNRTEDAFIGHLLRI